MDTRVAPTGPRAHSPGRSHHSPSQPSTTTQQSPPTRMCSGAKVCNGWKRKGRLNPAKGSRQQGCTSGPSMPRSIPKAQGAPGGGPAPTPHGHGFPLFSAPLTWPCSHVFLTCCPDGGEAGPDRRPPGCSWGQESLTRGPEAPLAVVLAGWHRWANTFLDAPTQDVELVQVRPHGHTRVVSHLWPVT